MNNKNRPGQSGPHWLDKLEQELGESVSRYTAVGGGDFADAFKVILVTGRQVFVKTHHYAIEEFFVTEATGLTWLRDTHTVAVPKVLAVADDPPLLALEWISAGQENQQGDAEFGRALAGLHRSSGLQFGRPDKRHTGSQRLPNAGCSTWVEFYATQRLMPLSRLSHDRKALPVRLTGQLDSIASRLADLGGPVEPPSLLHGDLWAGNRVTDSGGQSWLIDAAAHYGHREFDLAMMLLFGGFSETCFDAYREVAPLADGYESRISLHQLAPLVVHAIKFGAHYTDATADALNQYC